MSCTYLMTNNYLDSDYLVAESASSEKTAFPADNLYNSERRSKVWRSDGYWLIDDTNNTLVFRETLLTDLTATLTTGAYTSTAALLAEIKAQMESVGSSVYTLAVDTSTFKIKFTSDGAGGGGIFELGWPTATGLADTLGFNSGSDDTGALTYTADSLRINTQEWLSWDLGITSNPQAFILIGERNAPIKLTPAATITLQGNETDAWSTPSYSQVLTYDDAAISLFSTSGLHTEGLRYWRVSFVDKENANGFLEVGAIYLGTIFNSTRGGVQFPFQAQYVDNSTTIFSEGGQSFSDEFEKTESFSLEWNGLTITDKESIDEFFKKVGTARPFFVSVDSEAAFSSSGNYYVRYVKLVSPPSYSLDSPGVFSLSMQLLEQL